MVNLQRHVCCVSSSSSSRGLRKYSGMTFSWLLSIYCLGFAITTQHVSEQEEALFRKSIIFYETSEMVVTESSAKRVNWEDCVKRKGVGGGGDCEMAFDMPEVSFFGCSMCQSKHITFLAQCLSASSGLGIVAFVCNHSSLFFATRTDFNRFSVAAVSHLVFFAFEEKTQIKTQRK